MKITKSQSVSGNYKGHAVPAARTGAAQLQAILSTRVRAIFSSKQI
jgi:hypothetical protein